MKTSRVINSRITIPNKLEEEKDADEILSERGGKPTHEIGAGNLLVMVLTYNSFSKSVFILEPNTLYAVLRTIPVSISSSLVLNSESGLSDSADFLVVLSFGMSANKSANTPAAVRYRRSAQRKYRSLRRRS